MLSCQISNVTMVTMCLDDEGMGCCSPEGAGHEIHRPEGGRETQQGNHHQVWMSEILMIQGLNLCENILHVTDMGNLGKNKISWLTEIGFKMITDNSKRMHSSRMRTARLLTVSQHALPGGVPAKGVYRGRGYLPRGVPAQVLPHPHEQNHRHV